MAQKTTIVGKQGRGAKVLEQHVHAFKTAGGNHVGALTLTDPFVKFVPARLPFLNDDFGNALNQNISFSGTPEIIHNGGTSAEWDATAIQGTWNFADGGKISITSADNNDAASFAEEGATTIDMSGFTALTGEVDLDTYNATNNSIIIQFDLAGTPVGNSVDLNNFIDTGNFAAQNFVIPKADLGLTTQLLDGMTLTITRIGGTKPTIKFDDIQFEAAGTPAVFRATTPLGTKVHIDEIEVSMADDVTSIVTGSTTTFPTLQGIAYDAILGVSSLTNPIVFAYVKRGKVVLSVSITQIGDFLRAGMIITNSISDGTNTFLTMRFQFPHPIVLDGDDTENFLAIVISDNLSGLLEFTAVARGAREI